MEDIKQDTSQPIAPIPTGTTAPDVLTNNGLKSESSSSDNLSVEDAFFGQQETNNQPAPVEGQPAETFGNTEVDAPYEAKNDDKRFEYWQSQAAKKDNELHQFKTEVAEMIGQQKQSSNPQQPAKTEEFPAPPGKPQKPRGFSREEAWGDSNSESARYLDEVEAWQDSMNNYRDLRNQYDIALVREQLGEQEQAKRVDEARRAQYNQGQREKQEVFNHVQGHYGLSADDATEFIHTMSDPGSISMDNLVQLYRMNKGGEQVNTQSQGPSPAFQQSRNAQQVPSPMGVMPGQSSQDNRSDGDKIMDDIITDFKDKNPWGN